MTDFIQKDRELISEPAKNAESSSTERPTDRSRPLVTPPPPLETRSSSVTSGLGAGTAAARAQEEERVALFTSNEAADLRSRWDSIQVGFVDEPRKAVEEADQLVSATIKRLAEIFSEERLKLEHQWDRSDDISTEDFRVALRRYRSFFGRLLAI